MVANTEDTTASQQAILETIESDTLEVPEGVTIVDEQMPVVARKAIRGESTLAKMTVLDNGDIRGPADRVVRRPNKPSTLKPVQAQTAVARGVVPKGPDMTLVAQQGTYPSRNMRIRSQEADRVVRRPNKPSTLKPVQAQAAVMPKGPDMTLMAQQGTDPSREMGNTRTMSQEAESTIVATPESAVEKTPVTTEVASVDRELIVSQCKEALEDIEQKLERYAGREGVEAQLITEGSSRDKKVLLHDLSIYESADRFTEVERQILLLKRVFEKMDASLESAERQRGIYSVARDAVKLLREIPFVKRVEIAVPFVASVLSLPESLLRIDRDFNVMRDEIVAALFSAQNMRDVEINDPAQYAIRLLEINRSDGHIADDIASYMDGHQVVDAKEQEQGQLREIQILKNILENQDLSYTAKEIETLWSVVYKILKDVFVDYRGERLEQFEIAYIVGFMVSYAEKMTTDQKKEIFGVEELDAIPAGTNMSLVAFVKSGIFHAAFSALHDLSDKEKNNLTAIYNSGVITTSSQKNAATEVVGPRGLYDAQDMAGSFSNRSPRLSNKLFESDV